MKLLDVVALKTDIPEHGLVAGQVGTLVENLAEDNYLVEFSDTTGQTYALLPVEESDLLSLKYAKVA